MTRFHSRWGLRSERGDTLLEVVFALAILSMVLLSTTLVVTKSYRIGQTARERTIVSMFAQDHVEAVRNFRDNRKWRDFLYGENGSNGILNTAVSTSCRVTSPCMHMNLTTGLPVDGGTTSIVPTSYVEIVATPDDPVTPTKVNITVNYGFDNLGGGAANTNHISTTFADLTPQPQTSACFNPSDIMMVLDYSGSMNWAWQTGPRLDKQIEVAHNFIDNVSIGYNRAGIVTFHSFATLQSPLTYDIAALHASVPGSASGTGTNYLPGLNAADAQLASSARKVVVFISDGQNTDDSLAVIAKANQMKADSISIYTIAISPDNTYYATLAAMAGGPSGSFVSADQESELTAQMNVIANSLECGGP
jgi:uncharacterized protein YegL/type II secretory pathway pseudopilin PulG